MKKEYYRFLSYFHDGSLIKVKHENNNLRLDVISAEVFPEDFLRDHVIPQEMSFDRRIKGRILVQGIQQIIINSKLFQGELRMFHPSAEILDLNIEDHVLNINIRWESFAPNYREEDFSAIQVKAGNIIWENDPYLEDPDWRKEPVEYSGYTDFLHYHRLNPFLTGKRNKYLDENGNPVPHGGHASWLTPKREIVEKSSNSHPKFNPIGEAISLANYAYAFHDGDLINLVQDDEYIELVMISSEITPEETYGAPPLSSDNRIRGKLCLSGVTQIRDRNCIEQKICMRAEVGDIEYLKIEKEKIIIRVIWENFIPKFEELMGISRFEIEAEEIEWVPYPNLVDPYL